jgi:hypothetical protein
MRQGRLRLAGLGIPDTYRAAAASNDHRAGGDLPDRHRTHATSVAGHNRPRLAGLGVPDPHRAITTAGDDHRAAPNLPNRHRQHPIGVTGDAAVEGGGRTSCPQAAPGQLGVGVN